MTTNYAQPELEIHDPSTFGAVNAALERAFSSAIVGTMLKRAKAAGLRIREYEAVLSKGLLGRETAALYAKLVDSDRGQIRERYLRLVEQVAPELRKKFLKVYAYY